jgi:phage/plasmid-like protein (TIGR03299 family)
MIGLERAEDGRTAFATANVNAWHRLGTTTVGCMTAEQALLKAHLNDWEIEKQPVFAKVGNKYVEVPNKWATVRKNPFNEGQHDALGVVGRYYEPVQNEDEAELLNTLVSESGAQFETAGSLDDGKRVFVTMKLPDTVLFNGLGAEERTELYLCALDSKDGSSSFQFVVSPIRWVCANTVAAGLASAKSRFSARHTKKSAKAHVLEARRILGLTFQYTDELSIQIERLLEQEYSNQQFQRLTASLFPTPKDADPESSRVKNQQEHRDTLRSLWADSPTLEGIRGTKWAAYNAVTEYVDHYHPMKGAKGRDPEVARALQVVSGKSDGVKKRAFALLS